VALPQLEASVPGSEVGVNGYGFAINNNGFLVFHPSLNKEVMIIIMQFSQFKQCHPSPLSCNLQCVCTSTICRYLHFSFVLKNCYNLKIKIKIKFKINVSLCRPLLNEGRYEFKFKAHKRDQMMIGLTQ